MTRTDLVLGAALAGLVAALAVVSTAAAAAPKVIRLADYVEGAPQLGVDARANAVATWMQSAELAGGKPYETVYAVFASVRRAGRGFAAPRRVSSPDRGVRSWTTAVGSGGEGAIVWEADRPGSPLFVNRQRAGREIGPALPLTGSQGGSEPAAGIDARGRLLVAWLRPSGRDRCGMIVMASVAPRGGPFGTPRRVSGPCAHALFVRAALARNGDGAVAWRSSGARSAVSASSIQVSPYAGRRFRAPRTASAAPGVGFTLQLVAGGRQALAVWRDHGAVVPGLQARVMAATIERGRIAAPVEILSTRDALLRDVYAALSPSDAAIVAWQQAAPGASVFEALDARGVVAIRTSAAGPFGAPEVVAPYLELESSFGLTAVALDRAGRALAGYGGEVARRGARGVWAEQRVRTRPVDSYREGGDDLSMGVSDAGEAVAVWSLYSQDGGYYVRAAVFPAPTPRRRSPPATPGRGSP